VRPLYLLARLTLPATTLLLWGMRSRGVDHVPARGPVVIACNHISNWDPVLVGTACRRELHFLAKEELFRNRLFGGLIRAVNAIPVRRGALDRRALAAALDVLRRGGVLLMFPEGTRSRSGELGEARPGVGYVASAGRAVVVPAAVAGSHQLARAFARRRRVRVVFGEPFDAGEADSREGYEALTERIMGAIRELRRSLETP
jgi:1-acyl-sn-glycerol-3-phosphate acyltransferase